MRLSHVLTLCMLTSLLAACGGGGGDSGGAGGPTGPSLTLVTPGAGFVLGGQEVLVTGTGLTGTSEVTFDGVAAAYSVVDDTTIRATTPAGVAGPSTVAVATPQGAASRELFAYIAHPPGAAASLQIDDDLSQGGDSPYETDSPSICCSHGVIYVTWADARNAGAVTNLDVFFQRSLDGGRTWQPTDIRINTNSAGLSQSVVPAICCDGDHVHICWLDDRRGSLEPFARSSSDGGATWTPTDAQVAQTPSARAVRSLPQICCMGGTLHVVWTRAGGGTPATEIAYQRTTDGGLTWLPVDTLLGDFTPAVGLNIGQPSLCCGDGIVHVVWVDHRAGAHDDVWHTRTTDGGLTWSPDQRVDRDTTDRNAGSGPGFNTCCEGQNVFVVWADDRNAAFAGDGYDLYVNSSTDGGATFGSADRQVNALSFTGTTRIETTRPQLCCGNGTLHVVWADTRPVAPAMTAGPRNLYAQRSTDGGATWQVSDAALPVQPTGTLLGEDSTQACCSGNYVHVTYARTAGSVSDIHVVSSLDAGLTWPTQSVNLDDNDPADGRAVMGEFEYAAVCCDGARPYVVWKDSRNATVPAGGAVFDIIFGTYD